MKPSNPNTITVPGSTVDALRTYWELQTAAEVGRGRKKAAARAAAPQLPLAREERVRNYAQQSGWTTDFTPKQRRRLEKKTRRANPGFYAIAD